MTSNEERNKVYLGGILLTPKEVEKIKNPQGEIYTMPIYRIPEDKTKIFSSSKLP